MSATTPLEAITAAIASVDSGTLWSEGEDLLSALAEQGWLVVPAVSLPRSVPAGEPATAAGDLLNVTDRQWAVWWLLAFAGPFTDEQLAERYETFVDPDTAELLPAQTPQSIRSRRAELVRAGHVQRVPGERRPTSNGGSAAVWRAVGQRERIAA